MSQNLPKHPLKEIALCLSGGGYRAAAFHLGSMSYLYRINFRGIPLLQHVKAISTVSGGTFTGVLYALMVQKGKKFPELYAEIVHLLCTHDLVQESLEKIAQKGSWVNPTKSKNLINAFSEIYDELLTNGATFGALTNYNNTHLDLVAFNATEFRNGLNFRFQAEWKGKQQNGNLSRGAQFYRLSQEEQNEIKLSDIIAASSCFPGGFEPMRFPTDFIHTNSPLLEKMKEEEKYQKDIGIMDGGIYDNQGIDSIQLSENRRLLDAKQRNPYDLILISDVSSPDILHPFHFHETVDRNFSHLSYANLRKWIQHLDQFYKIFILILIIAGGLMVFWQEWENTTLTGIGIAMMVLGLVLFGLVSFIQKYIRKTKNSIGNLIKGELDPFYQKQLALLPLQKFTIKDFEPLILDRANSLLLMVKDIFIKQVRRLKYKSIYEDTRYENRRVANLIKCLTKDDWPKTKNLQDLPNIPSRLSGSYEEVVGTRLQSITEEAASFGTTLWFTEEDKLTSTIDCLLATGQATICYVLMDYLIKLMNHPEYENYSLATKTCLQQVLDQALFDWEKFYQNPTWMVRKV